MVYRYYYSVGVIMTKCMVPEWILGIIALVLTAGIAVHYVERKAEAQTTSENIEE